MTTPATENPAPTQAAKRPARWYVLTHPDAERVAASIDRSNEAWRRPTGEPVYHYFIPYAFIKKRTTKDAVDARNRHAADDVKHNNRLRNTLRRFVFVRATAGEVRRLLREPWNREAYQRLQPYAAGVGDMRYVSDQMMDRFIGACYDQREKFELTPPPVEGVGVGSEVTIREGCFKETKATVTEVVHKADGIHLTLSIPFFSQGMNLTLHDIKPSQVDLCGEAAPFVTTAYADYAERLLLDILSRRVNHKETDETHMADLERLGLVWRYRPTKVENLLERAHVAALLLVCARLRYDSEALDRLKEKCSDILAQLEHLRTSQRRGQARAALHIALFMATGDPAHRTRAKELVFRHTAEGHPLRRFLSLIRR